MLALSNSARKAAAARQTPPHGNEIDLLSLGRLVWTELPVMAVINFLIGLALSLVVMTALSVVALAPLVAAFTVGPIWLGAVSNFDRMLAGGDAGIRELLREIRRRARTGVMVAFVPASIATVLICSVGLLSGSDNRRWMILPIAVDLVVLIVLGFACLSVFPLAVSTTLRGQQLWIVAIAQVGQRLTTSLGIVALVILLVLSIRFVGPFLALVAVAPLCLLITATANTATNQTVGSAGMDGQSLGS